MELPYILFRRCLLHITNFYHITFLWHREVIGVGNSVNSNNNITVCRGLESKPLKSSVFSIIAMERNVN